MNKKLIWILVYFLIVMASVFVVYMRYDILTKDNVTTFDYIIFIFFILFTYINVRKLVQLIKSYKI